MRIILSLLMFISACNSGPQKEAVSFKDLEPLQGNWLGVQNILAADDIKWDSYPTTLDITAVKDSLQLDFSLKQSDEEKIKETGIFYIHEDGKKLDFGPSEYDIQSVSRANDELVIVAIKEDEDNDKPADIRLTIKIGAKKLTMLREVKYKGTANFFDRIDLKLGKIGGSKSMNESINKQK